MHKITIILILITTFLFSNSYRTIQRTTPIITKDGTPHNQIKDFGEYYALLIYVEDYTYINEPKLTTPKKNIEALKNILIDRYFFKEKNVLILPNPKNNQELIDILEEYISKLDTNDNLLIYYAGHGEYIKKIDSGYWLFKDAKKNSRKGWVSFKEDIKNNLMLMKTKHVLVIADSCYSGALTKRGTENSFDGLSKSDREYYSKLFAKKSRNVLTSGALEPVLDSSKGGNPNHTPFANGLLNMLEDNIESIFTMEEKYPLIKKYVELDETRQTPIYSGISGTGHTMGGDFIFLDKKSIYANKDIKITSKSETPKVVYLYKNSSNIEKYLIWALGGVSFLFLLILIIHLKSKKNDHIIVEDITNEPIIPKPKKEPKPKPKKQEIKGTIEVNRLLYQNQPFTKQYTWQEAKKYAKNLKLGGFNDWRLPTREELRRLANIKLYGEYDVFWEEWYQNHKDSALINSKKERHFIQKEFLDNMPKDSYFWTSERKDKDDIWRVGFHLGCDDVSYDEDINYIMCVRDKERSF